MPPFSDLALRAIQGTAVPSLLISRHAVVLERIARGGGATRWFWLGDPDRLGDLAATLSPGSAVSFYFDERIAERAPGVSLIDEIEAIAREDHDAFVGRLVPGALEFEVEFVSSRAEAEEYAESVEPQDRFFVGRFPSRDDDGNDAVTVDLPDLDGVIRRHPH